MAWCSEQYRTDVFPPDSRCTIQNCYSLRVDRAAMCIAHKCQDPTCGNYQFDLSRSCVSHKCHFSGCLRKRCSEYNVCCDIHNCWNSYCQNLKEMNGGRMFCLPRNCSKSGCLSPIVEGTKLCVDHVRVN
ncbi:hypothetical protein EAF00_010139 [Botryotinia globosa]|nr:hypothetical protein EAF00_010139 [Botryotinia globosa]